jgi:hypothetical protein
MSGASKAKGKHEEKHSETHEVSEAAQPSAVDKNVLIKEALDLIKNLQHHNDFTRGWIERANRALAE